MSEVPNRSLPCRCAVTDVLFPKPSWKMRFGKQNTSVQHFSAAIRIQQSLLNQTNATLTRIFCTTLLFKTLNYRSLRDCNTPFLLHFTCAILITFPEGKNSQSITSLCSRRKGTAARQSCKPQLATEPGGKVIQALAALGLLSCHHPYLDHPR